MLDILTALTFGFAIYGVIEATRKLLRRYRITFQKQIRCPECDGTNLDTAKTKCWDCSASDEVGE